jgi:GABA(A) receptor-associated protein
MEIEKLTIEDRKAEVNNISSKYPDRIPVIVKKSNKSKLNDIDKKKFLVPKDLTIGQFMYVIRKRIQLGPGEAIFLFINNIIPATTSLMETVYENNKSEDGFLYIEYNGEEAFG